MAQAPTTQIHKILDASKNILIVLPEHLSGDVLAAGYALAHYSNTSGASPLLVTSDKEHIRDEYTFLPQPEHIRDNLHHARDFLLTFDTTHNAITNVRSVRNENTITIHVTPEKGMIDSRDFSFGLADFPFDIIITLGMHTREDAGSVFLDTPDVFYDIPIVSIDTAPDNSNFGHINFIARTASSLSEVIADLLLTHHPDHVTADVAQCLLTGIISATDSFRSTQTTPHALSRASDLIDCGANQQEIVTHLYKSQPLSLLQIWGRALKNLRTYESDMIITTTLSASDFDETNTTPHIIATIIEKIKQNHTTAKAWVVFYEEDQQTKIYVDANRIPPLPVDLFGTPEGVIYRTRRPESTPESTYIDAIRALISQ